MIKDTLDRESYAICPAVLTQQEVKSLRAALTAYSTERKPGIREIAAKLPEVKSLAFSQKLLLLAQEALGAPARLVRSIYFNKSADSNWKVIWHQDLTIAVRHKADIDGYEPWSVKEGIYHVQPPLDILERMVTIRIHLDDTDEANGALMAIPGSHRLGRLTASDAVTHANHANAVTCRTTAGDALLMKPHILHASRKGTDERPRRVLHFEYCSAELPKPLE